LQWQVAGLRYAVHTLRFPEPSELQKQWALVASCPLADQIATTVQANLVLRVDWVESPSIGPGRLGMTICPGRRDRDRNLEGDLARPEDVDRLLCHRSRPRLSRGSRSRQQSRGARAELPLASRARPGNVLAERGRGCRPLVSGRARARRVGRSDVYGWSRSERDDRRVHAGRPRRLANGRDRVGPGRAGCARSRRLARRNSSAGSPPADRPPNLAGLFETHRRALNLH